MTMQRYVDGRAFGDSGMNRTMINEFTAIYERDGDWYIGYSRKSRGPTARARRWRNVARA